MSDAEKRSATSYAVLGLLSVRPWTTYELAKQVQRSLNWFWPRAERKLYDEPKRLLEQGLVSATQEMTGNRPRTVYAITRKGRSALRSWLSERPEPPTVEFEGMVKVFFADSGSKEQLLATIDEIESEASRRLSALAEMAGGPIAFPKRAHLNAIALRLQHDQEEAVARWANWARRQVDQWADAADPGDWDSSRVLSALASASADKTAG